MVQPVKQLLEFGPFRVDPEQRILFRENEPIFLSPKAFDLLMALLERHGQVVLKDDLMKQLWPDTFVEESNLGQHVFQLRRALGDRAQGSSYIVTVPGRGYRLAQGVRILPGEGEDILVASHSRSRVVIEEKIENPSSLVSEPPRLDASGQGLLPGCVSRSWRKSSLAALVGLGALVGAVMAWILVRPAPVPKVLRSVQLSHFGRVEPLSRALSDGTRIFFTVRIGGTWRLAQISESGGEPTDVTNSVRNTQLQDVDRYRGRLLVTAQSDLDTGDALWIIPAAGGSGRRVGDVLANEAAWSHDGQRIAYCISSDLFVVGDDGAQPQKIFSAHGLIEFPRWSPDAKHLTFTVRDALTGVVSVWQIHPDGRDAHPLSLGWNAPTPIFGQGECCGDWSPDGRYFLFRSSRDWVESIWILRTKNGALDRRQMTAVQLYTSPDRLNEPRFSPDGRKVFFVDFRQRRELVRYDAERKVFVPYLGGIAARHLRFSRNGKWVAYKKESDDTLWRSRVDGTEALQLTFPPLDTYHPDWFPDDEKIVFEGNKRLYTVPFAGGKTEPLSPEGISAGQPSVSPDGKSLLFTEWPPPGFPILYRMDLDTRQVTKIPGSEDFEGAQWSPDGKYAVAADRKDRKLMLFDFAIQKWSELADGLPYGWGIRWSSDSQYVYYQHHYGGEEQPIFRVRVSDHLAEQITSARQILRADVLSYAMTGLTPDNFPLASLVHTNSDVYALELDIP
jgi:DNA-binding winged helix-turn-helix (wHTH) protein/Tol biopolymer transport system component